ncbi:MAG: ATP-binding protein, partial [Planctomycetota bacterium]
TLLQKHHGKKNPRNAVRLVAALGLAIGALMIVTVTVSLRQIQQHRAIGERVYRSSMKSLRTADDIFSATYDNTRSLLMQPEVLPTFDTKEWPGFPEYNIADVLEYSSRQSLRKACKDLENSLSGISDLNYDCLLFALAADEAESSLGIALKEADSALSELRKSMAGFEGRQLLAWALQVRDFRRLSGEQRDAKASEILSRDESIANCGDMINELSDLRLLVQELGATSNIDGLADLVNNRVHPHLDRLNRLITTHSDHGFRQHNLALLRKLEIALFGRGSSYDPDHQSVQFGDGGLYNCRKRKLECTIQENDLHVMVQKASLQFSASRVDLLKSLDEVSRSIADNAASLISKAWYLMVIVGSGLSLLFLLLTKRISRTVHNQFLAIEKNSEQIAKQSQELRESSQHLELLSLVARHTANLVLITNSDREIDWVNDGFLRTTGFENDEVIGTDSMQYLSGPQEIIEDIESAFANGVGFDVETLHYKKTGEPFWVSIEGRPIDHQPSETSRFIIIKKDVTLRVNAEQERQQLSEKLVDASRKAGMAEIAADVLHNVGNVLNSINVSTSCIQNVTRRSVIDKLAMVSELVEAHADDFGDYVANDKKGKYLPQVIVEITSALKQEQQELSKECTCIENHVEHIKEVIAVQQDVSKAAPIVMQELRPAELFQNALSANRGTLEKSRIEVTENYDDSPVDFISDKHKILQVLINLIGNAKDAVLSNQSSRPKIGLRIYHYGQLHFEVTDNGVGISSENLTQIFQHGFTTKPTGHGFGLHSCANIATELGGSLTVESDGVGTGATFRLSLPLAPSNTSCEADSEAVLSSSS